MEAVADNFAYGETAVCREAVGVFGDLESTQRAVEELQVRGFSRSDISTLARMDTVESTLGHGFRDITEIEDDPKAERSIFITRRSLGDAEGLMIAVGIYFGAVVGAGIAAGRGWSDQGIILAVILLGGVGALIGYAVARWLGSRYDRWFTDQLNRGGIVLWVTVHSPEQEERALGVLRAHAARDVHVHELPIQAVSGPRLPPRPAPQRIENWFTTGQPAMAAPVARRAVPVDAAAPVAIEPETSLEPGAHGGLTDFRESVADLITRAKMAEARRARPIVRRIGLADVRDALRHGIDDFLATPTQLLFLGIIYPIIGLVAARAAAGDDLLPLFYPLVAGISLMGPFVAVGIYELSRRREQGLEVSWVNAFDVRRSPSFFSILLLGLMLLTIFIAWLAAAMAIYRATLGPQLPDSVGDFSRQLFGTPEGWQLILLGNGVGFLFAVVVLTTTVVSFPLLLDRNVGAVTAVRASVRAVIENPVPMMAWGLIVAGLLLLGSLPFFIGLVVVMPVLGHATWHLYRKVVAGPV